MEVTIRQEGIAVNLTRVTKAAAAQLMADTLGWTGLDIEPMGPGRARLSCKHPRGASIIINGSSVEDVCGRLITLMSGDANND